MSSSLVSWSATLCVNILFPGPNKQWGGRHVISCVGLKSQHEMKQRRITKKVHNVGMGGRSRRTVCSIMCINVVRVLVTFSTFLYTTTLSLAHSSIELAGCFFCNVCGLTSVKTVRLCTFSSLH